jgi:hypothetical protein
MKITCFDNYMNINILKLNIIYFTLKTNSTHYNLCYTYFICTYWLCNILVSSYVVWHIDPCLGNAWNTRTQQYKGYWKKYFLCGPRHVQCWATGQYTHILTTVYGFSMLFAPCSLLVTGQWTHSDTWRVFCAVWFVPQLYKGASCL